MFCFNNSLMQLGTDMLLFTNNTWVLHYVSFLYELTWLVFDTDLHCVSSIDHLTFTAQSVVCIQAGLIEGAVVN